MIYSSVIASQDLAVPVGADCPQVIVVGTTEHPETSDVLVVLHDVEAEVGHDTQISVTVEVDVHPVVVVVLAAVPFTSQP